LELAVKEGTITGLVQTDGLADSTTPYPLRRGAGSVFRYSCIVYFDFFFFGGNLKMYSQEQFFNPTVAL
jgi:hypothetical protein